MSEKPPPPEPDSGRAFLLGLALGLAALSATILAPFLCALLAAASLALLLEPVRARLAVRAPERPAAVAAALAAAASLLVLLPATLGGWALLHEAAEAYPAARAGLVNFPFPSFVDPRATALANLDQISAWAGRFAGALVRDAALVLLNLAVFVAALFLFLRDGPLVVRRATALIPLPAAKMERLVSRLREVLLAVINGIFAIALIQGALAWLGFALLGVPFAGLLGALCAALSPVPLVGSALVWVPVALWTLLAGAKGKAAALVLWFALVVGLSDNVARPALLGAQTKLPVPLVFISIAGALKAFGLAGLFVGPLAVALALSCLDLIDGRDG